MVTLFSTVMSSSSLIMVNITSCFRELLPFVHQKMSFLALLEYATFALAWVSVSHGHIQFICVACAAWSTHRDHVSLGVVVVVRVVTLLVSD